MQLCYCKCLSCDNQWIDFQKKKKSLLCPLCGKKKTSEPVFIGKIRRALEILNEELRNLEISADAYNSKRKLIYEMYCSIIPTVLDRSGKIFSIAVKEILMGSYNVDVLSRLSLAALAFAETGFAIPSALSAMLLSVSFMLRNYDDRYQRSSEEFYRISQVLEYSLISKNIMALQTIVRLLDFYRAMEWAQLFAHREWRGALHLMISKSLLRDPSLYTASEQQGRAQLSYFHLREAGKNIGEMDDPVVSAMIDRDIRSTASKLNDGEQQKSGQEDQSFSGSLSAIDELKVEKRLELIGRCINDGLRKSVYELIDREETGRKTEGSAMENLIFLGPALLNSDKKRDIHWAGRLLPDKTRKWALQLCSCILRGSEPSPDSLIEMVRSVDSSVRTMTGMAQKWLSSQSTAEVSPILNNVIIWGLDEIVIESLRSARELDAVPSNTGLEA